FKAFPAYVQCPLKPPTLHGWIIRERAWIATRSCGAWKRARASQQITGIPLAKEEKTSSDSISQHHAPWLKKPSPDSTTLLLIFSSHHFPEIHLNLSTGKPHLGGGLPVEFVPK